MHHHHHRPPPQPPLIPVSLYYIINAGVTSSNQAAPDCHFDLVIRSSKDDGFDLHYACENGHLDIVKYLVNTLHCDPQMQDTHGRSPLNLAAGKGRLEVVKFFLEDLKLDCESSDRDGYVPLHFASMGGHLNVVKYLFNEHHCNPQAKGFVSHTPLHLAASNGQLEVVKFLCEYLKLDCDSVSETIQGDVNFHMMASDGYTPLHYASKNGHLDVVKYLVEVCSFDPLIPSRGGTSLYLAEAKGHVEIVKYFKEQGKVIMPFNLGSYDGQDKSSVLLPLRSAVTGEKFAVTRRPYSGKTILHASVSYSDKSLY